MTVTSNHRLAAAFLIASAASSLLPAQSAQQVTRADYDRAASLGETYRNLLIDNPENPTWVADEDTLVYSLHTRTTHQFVQVEAATGKKSPAFDHARLAAALSESTGHSYNPDSLPFSQFRFLDKHASIEFSLNQEQWHCDLATYHCATPPHDHPHPDDDSTPPAANSLTDQRTSPDGKWQALIVNFNVVLRPVPAKPDTPPPSGKPATRKDPLIVLSTDGSEDNYYSLDSLSWSPDSTHLVAYRIRPGYKRLVRYTESAPATQLQPIYTAIPYTKAGDTLDLPQPVLFDVAAKRELPIANTLFPNPFDLSPAQWWKDSRGFTFDYNQRGHQLYRVVEVDAHTAAARTLVEESSTAFVDYRALVNDIQDTGKIYRHDIADGKELLWMSERDGWAHLYLVDGHTGATKNLITKGDWVVRSVDYVDDANREIYFEASGMTPGEDPYFEHAYRIHFDGTGLTPLTPGEGNHHIEFSSNGAYFTDLHSTINEAPTLDLYSRESNKKIATLEQADLTQLKAAGWAAPEPFMALGRDHKTEIWGVMYKPANFDPTKKYPVIEDIYAGPQGSFVPKSFTPRPQPLTQLGFIVVQIDGMGTNNRSKAFHDVAWKNLKDAGFADRILWHQAAAAKYPWYDISNVGLFGTSAGGQSAMGALLFHPEFYKVAVSNSGCHDNRMDKIWWNEQWMGWPIGPEYAASSNVDNAWRLQGKLMLVVGELDDNVDPASTFQVADRLEKANKYFDLLYVPGGRHGAGGAYGYRKLEDFFVTNILKQQPPDWNLDPAPESTK